jgi:hypothetical protein
MSGSATADPPCASAQGKKESQDDFTAAMTNMIPNSGPSPATPRRIWHVPVPRPRSQRFTRFCKVIHQGQAPSYRHTHWSRHRHWENVLLLRRHPVILKRASFRSPRTDPPPNPSPAHLLQLPKSHDSNPETLLHLKPPPLAGTGCPNRHLSHQRQAPEPLDRPTGYVFGLVPAPLASIANGTANPPGPQDS